MLTVEYHHTLLKTISKIQDGSVKQQVKPKKIVENPVIYKPIRYDRKDTQEVSIGSYRLAYSYSKKDEIIIFLSLYHKDKQ
jgi:mRNA-degrading endonuclease RelE of RelBE toxin-antitoxin system